MSESAAESTADSSESKPAVEHVKQSSDSLWVKKIDGLKDDFIMGCDISSVISLENSGVKFYDYDGKEADIFATLKASGVNYIRVRIWADPSKQMCPKAWKGMDIDQKKQALYDYTKECMKKLNDAGADVGMVQLGNETNGSMSGEKIWMNIYYLMDAGSRAVRETNPDALIAVHFTNPESVDRINNYASKLDYYSLDYDVFASS